MPAGSTELSLSLSLAAAVALTGQPCLQQGALQPVGLQDSSQSFFLSKIAASTCLKAT